MLTPSSRHSSIEPLPGRQSAQPVVWMHSGTPDRLAALGDLAKRLKQLRNDVYVVTSTDRDLGTEIPEGVDHQVAITSDTAAEAARRVTDWAPWVTIWAGADVLPRHVKKLQATQALSILCDVSADDVPVARHRWVPDATRTTFAAFDAIYANDAATSSALETLALAGVDVRTGSALERVSVPPSCSEEDVTELKAALGGRACWLAAQVSADEAAIVLRAHRTALRLHHRLLLILMPAAVSDLPDLRQSMSADGVRYADWDQGELPADLTQVLISEASEDLGIWYRLASLCFLGGTFDPRGAAPHPMDPAALGSAVLCGPAAQEHTRALKRLTRAGGALVVSDPARLGDAVLNQIAPHHAAAMALAAWEVATSASELIDQLVEHMVEHLDHERSGRARS